MCVVRVCVCGATNPQNNTTLCAPSRKKSKLHPPKPRERVREKRKRNRRGTGSICQTYLQPLCYIRIQVLLNWLHDKNWRQHNRETSSSANKEHSELKAVNMPRAVCQAGQLRVHALLPKNSKWKCHCWQCKGWRRASTQRMYCKVTL